jgi:hypothetical protein
MNGILTPLTMLELLALGGGIYVVSKGKPVPAWLIGAIQMLLIANIIEGFQ